MGWNDTWKKDELSGVPAKRTQGKATQALSFTRCKALPGVLEENWYYSLHTNESELEVARYSMSIIYMSVMKNLHAQKVARLSICTDLY